MAVEVVCQDINEAEVHLGDIVEWQGELWKMCYGERSHSWLYDPWEEEKDNSSFLGYYLQRISDGLETTIHIPTVQVALVHAEKSVAV
ncbi:hypothetical protein [Ectobacillus panaciterrae]|uniref:hypothetical protein n=1 Tax=Ectobacillus panaciterrae TaxID=363872 RepID=UPI000408C5E2|nr:hypothetical protein [Ectobacillus panaciterrae]